mmetsp:Transcript_52300/g.93341  ORF Transcript_52300/g.93341 Transcript_52300/m.93341 type:complete len:210 (+) Transcript_52300:2592-3221(+)
MSRLHNSHCRVLGMSPRTIRWAKPSTIAVLPTPGSPISTGLFLVRRARTRMTRRISSSRPMTGSNFPISANSTMLMPYLRSASNVPSAPLLSTLRVPRMREMTSSHLLRGSPLLEKACPTSESSYRARKRTSKARYVSFCFFCSSVARFSTFRNFELAEGWQGGSWDGSFRNRVCKAESVAATSQPARIRIRVGSSCLSPSIARATCTG